MTLLQDFTKAELTEYIVNKYNAKPFVGGQLYAWLTKGANYCDMSNINKNLKEHLQQDCLAQSVSIMQSYTSDIDGTQKFLYKLHDGNIIEGVLMKYKYGNTLCVSTQVGCRMGCRFCASTIGGLVRNLSAGEILGQVVAVNALGATDKSRYITNIVLMGSGEPLDNYDNVIKFLQLVSSTDGLNISCRNISLSTCGLVDKMRLLADSNLPVNMTISLHNAIQEGRQQIMPIANKYSVDEVMKAGKYYFDKTGRRVIVEYTLIDGVNDSYRHALVLSSVCRNMSVHINLIRLNPVKEAKLRSTTDANAKKFLGYLEKMKLSATLRRQMGVDIQGACGQLRRNYIDNGDSL